MLHILRRIVLAADLLLKGLIAAIVGLMLVIVVLQVFCRYVLHNALSWPEEASRYLMIWSGLLAAIYAYHEGSHVGVTFLLTKLNDRLVTFISIASHILMGGFLLVVSWEGFNLLHQFSSLKSPALRIPMSFVYAAVPISFGIMLLVCLKLTHGAAFGQRD